MEILIEPVLPAPRLFIVGETPIVTTLIELARVMGYRVNQFERAADLALQLGATETPDAQIIQTASHLYRHHSLRRVYYSAFSPIPRADRLFWVDY